MSPRTLRHSLLGAAGLGGAVAVSGVVGALGSDAPPLAVLQPVTALVVLAATVGGLTGPLVVPLVLRALGRTSGGRPSA